MRLTFHGGALSVTGANYLLEHNGTKILVDCGLAQGSKYAEHENYEDFKYDPKTIDYLFITHSHIDHIGRAGKLYKEGFRGKVMTTTATCDLMRVALPDNTSHIMHEAEQDGHDSLFEQEDMNGLLGLLNGYLYDEEIKISNDIAVTFHDSGHILGSAFIEFTWIESDGTKKNIVFSGDLGNSPTPLLRDKEFMRNVMYVVTESTYGDRVHEPRKERQKRLINIITDTVKNNGVLMIPSFAMERTQELLYEFNNICENNLCPRVPIYIDSPLAIKVTEVYKQHSEYFNQKTNYAIRTGDDIFNFPGLKFTLTSEESKKINETNGSKIIIAGAGMSNGGRIMHHEKLYLGDPKNALLFVGYQADGTLGRRIQRGDKEVKIFGESVKVRAQLQTISSYSAHADQPNLLKWVESANSKGNTKKVFVVQGEDESARTLANLLHDQCGLTAVVPVKDQIEEL